MNHPVAVLRSAVRSALRQKRLTLGVVLTLGTGVGLITLVFNVLNGYLWRPLPWPAADRLVSVGWEDPQRPPGRSAQATAVLAQELRENASTFAAAGAATQRAANLTLDETTQPAVMGAAEPAFLGLLGARPVAGRLFTEAEAASGEPVIVLSHAIWETRFAADPAAVGRTVRLDGEPVVVIGVLPRDFAWESEEVWRPLSDARTSAVVLATLRPGASLDAARSELAAIEAGMAAPRPGMRLRTSDPVGRVPVSSVLWILGLFIGATGFVVLIAGSNVTNLLLAAGAAKRGERAVRLALGATRGRIMVESLSESLVLGLAAGVLGLVVALWGTDLLVALVPNNMPRWIRFGVDLRVLAFAAGLGMLTATVVGVAPARDARRADVLSLLRNAGVATGETTRTARWRRFIIAGEIALSAALVTATLQAWRSAAALDDVDPGYDAASVLSVELALAANRYGTAEATASFHRDLADRAARLPGVETTSIRGGLARFTDTGDADTAYTLRPYLEAREAGAVGARGDIDIEVVDADYLDAIRLPLLRGRFFDERDRSGGQRVAVLSERLAGELWPGQDPLGRDIRVDTSSGRWATVIGTVGDRVEFRGGRSGLAPDRRRTVYFHAGQAVASNPELLVRAPADPVAIVPALRAALADIDPEQAISRARTLEEATFDGPGLVLQVFGGMLGAIGVTGLVLAMIGLYGLVSHRTLLRTREIGVRIALGAAPRTVAIDIIGDAAVLAALGLGAGLVLTLAITRMAGGLVFGFAVAGFDPVANGATLLVFSAVTLAAAWLPARRAMAADPLTAIHDL